MRTTLALSLLACSPIAGELLVEAGCALDPDAAAQDGGVQLVPDAGLVAHLPESVDVGCNEIGVFETDMPDGSVDSRVTYYATIRNDSIEELLMSVRAFGCDRFVLGSDPETTFCAPGATCSDTRMPPMRCTELPIQIEQGTARVVCGNVHVLDPDGDGPMARVQNGVTYQLVRFILN